MKMKCLIFFLLVLSLTTLLTNCDPNNKNSGTTTTTTTTIPYLTVHYQRNAGDYENFTLWLWNDTTWASEKGWPYGLDWESKDDFGATFKVPLKEAAQTIGLVPVNKTIGDDSKDAGDHIFKFLNLYKEIWIFQDDAECYVSKDKKKAGGLIGGYILNQTEIYLTFLDVDSVQKSDISIVDKNDSPLTVNSVEKDATSSTLKYKVTINSTDPGNLSPYKVTYKGLTITISLGWQNIEQYAYDGNDLGCTYSSGSATFKLWAPTATEVKVVFYDKTNSGTDLKKDITLTKDNKGIWSATITPSQVGVSDLKGYFYQYRVTNTGSTTPKLCLDPYAKSMAASYIGTGGKVDPTAPDQDLIGKAAIIDMTETGTVTSFANLPTDWKREDTVIYEVHMRDFTSYFGVNPTGKYPSEVTKPTNKLGTYKAFIENLDYIKNMGYTHIQLLPVMNFYYGIETNNSIETEYKGESCNYNWGFDPQHYFTPEGMYSTDATNPVTRVKELKELIQAIHNKGMAVILDVVYTHMAKADFLNDIVPNYYFFMQNGAFVGSFGNNLATTHIMPKKLMIDSVKYWMNEYKVDGFRFDMMGDADQKSIMDTYDEAYKINPKVLFLGEAWRGYKGGAEDGSYGADQDSMNEMNSGAERIAGFSDEFRNLMKSGFGAEGTPKFITGGAVNIASVLSNIKGQPSNFNTATYSFATKNSANDPGQTVPYIAAHDNMTLHDIISRHIGGRPDVSADEIHKRTRLGNLIVATTQGVAFFHAGQDLGVTKQYKGTEANKGTKVTTVTYPDGSKIDFIHDSYDSSDAVNQINWGNIVEGQPGRLTMTYTKGLLALRKSTDAFRLGDKVKIDANITKINFVNESANDLVLGYSVKGSDATYYVFINCAKVTREASLSTDLTTGTVLVDNDESGITAVTNPSGYTLTTSKITLEPLTAVIIKK